MDDVEVEVEPPRLDSDPRAPLHGIATRNIADFEPTGVPVIDPGTTD